MLNFRTRMHTFFSPVTGDDCPVVVDETGAGLVEKPIEETSSALQIFFSKSKFRSWQNGSSYLPLTLSMKIEEIGTE